MSNDPTRPLVEPQSLAHLVPLSGIRPEHLTELARHVGLITVARGTELPERPDLLRYLVEGELELRSGELLEDTLVGGAPDTRFSLPTRAQGFTSIRARADSKLLAVDRTHVSTLLILGQAPQVRGDLARPGGAWAARLLRSELFARVPPANVQRIFEVMEPFPVEPGEVVVAQGTPGDYYYVVRDGSFEVVHESEDGAEPVRVAEFEPGDTFGEEALVSGALRNATVRALTHGTAARLTQGDFVQLIQDPVLDRVSRARADDLVRAGARWLDIRLPEEHARNGIECSLNIPLSDVRARAGELDRDSSYVVYSNNGGRSAAAAFLLSQAGLHASILDGGLLAGSVAAATEEDAQAGGSQLRDELLAANQDLEDALRQKAEVEAARMVTPVPGSASTAEAEAELGERQRALEAESMRATEALAAARRRKLELEELMRAGEAQAASERRQAQETIDKLRADAQQRLKQEEERLQVEFSQAAEQMKRLAAARREAEERFERERERLEAELATAREAMEAELQRVRDEIQSARQSAEQRASAIRNQQSATEAELREDTERRLRDERTKLESEFAMSLAAQEKAQGELEAADQALLETHQESERLAQRIEAERLRREAEERARQEAERDRLETERQRAAEELAAAEAGKRAAEAALASALPEPPPSPRSVDPEDEVPTIRLDEREEIELEIARANEALESARLAKQQADHAHTHAEKRIAAQRAVEEELRLQLIREAETWLEEERMRSEDELDAARREAHDKAIERRRAVKLYREKAADQNLLDDIGAQLGEDSIPTGNLLIEHSLQERAYAEERAAIAQRAKEEATAERIRAEKALEEARERIGMIGKDF